MMKQIEVVAAIIRKDGRIFATQRGYGEWKDWWAESGELSLNLQSMDEPSAKQ